MVVRGKKKIGYLGAQEQFVRTMMGEYTWQTVKLLTHVFLLDEPFVTVAGPARY
jgi:hypothetical protein